MGQETIPVVIPDMPPSGEDGLAYVLMGIVCVINVSFQYLISTLEKHGWERAATRVEEVFHDLQHVMAEEVAKCSLDEEPPPGDFRNN